MIRVTCLNCASKLNAKDELAGQMRMCPKCAQPLHIVADGVEDPNAITVDEALPDQHVLPATEEHLPIHRPIQRLNRENHYLICDKTHLVAAWENNGKGWMIKTGAGLISAKRNLDKLPSSGNFHLVELKFNATPDGKRLTGIACYQFASQGAGGLTTLDQGDDPILEKLSGPDCLNRDQKNAVRQALKEQFMRPVWQDAADVLDYLANADFHSPGVG